MSLLVTPGQLSRRADLYHQLSQTASAGIPLLQCLETAAASTPDRELRAGLRTLQTRLEEGCTLSASLEGLEAVFSPFERALLAAAEQSGQLPENFKALARHHVEKAATIRRLMGLVLYPFFLLHLAVFIFPIEALQGLVLQGEVSRFVWGKIVMLAPLYGVGLLLAYLGQERRGQAWREAWDGILMRVPVLGRARLELGLSRLAGALAAMLRAGVPILSAWKTAGPASGSPRLARAALAVRHQAEDQSTPSEILQRSRLFPTVFANHYASGELSGTLDESLEWLHRFYQEEGERRMRRAVVMAGGGIYFGVVLIVAWRVLSFYIGYFKQIGDAIPD